MKHRILSVSEFRIAAAMAAMIALLRGATAFAADAASTTGAYGTQTSSVSASPTLSGGLSASARSTGDDYSLFIDGYYTPFGDNMKGGGLSIEMECVDPEDNNGIGFRFGGFHASGSQNEYDMSMTSMSMDLYLLHRIEEVFSLYAGLGLFVMQMEMEVPYVKYMGRKAGTIHSTQDAEGDAGFFSGFAGARLRILGSFAIFAEYRYENGDVELTLSKSHTGMKAKDVGGGRFVFGGGLAF